MAKTYALATLQEARILLITYVGLDTFELLKPFIQQAIVARQSLEANFSEGEYNKLFHQLKI